MLENIDLFFLLRLAFVKPKCHHSNPPGHWASSWKMGGDLNQITMGI